MELLEPTNLPEPPMNCMKEIMELTESEMPYTVGHIRIAASAIYSNYNAWTGLAEFETAFLATVFDTSQQQNDQNAENHQYTNALETLLSNFSISCKRKHFCIIASTDGNNWITLFLVKAVGTIRMLYFDPCGNKPLEELLAKIERHVSLEEIITHVEDPIISTIPVDSNSTGSVCLAYYDMILSKSIRGQDIIPTMQSKSFYQVLAKLNMQGQQRKLEILAVKERLQKLCYLQQAIASFSILCSNDPNFADFKMDLNKFFKDFSSIKEVEKDLSVHLNLLQKATVSQADLGNLDENLLKQLEAAKQAVYGSAFVKMILKRGEDLIQNHAGGFEASHFIHEVSQRLREKYPKLLDAFSEFLKILISCSHYSNISTGNTLLKICTLLELDWSTFYKMVQPKLNPNFPKIPMEILTSSEGIDSFLQSLANASTDHQEHENFQDDELFNQWLQELRDFLKQNLSRSDMDSVAVDKLEKGCNDFLSQANNWKKASAVDIYNWAREAKGERRKPTPEIIAVIDRAYQILTKGKRLRASQVLALLLVEGASPIKGTILHIPPEEGTRSTDIAMIATLKILRGESTVDIITSHPTVADASLRCSADFYRLFQIHVATNNDGNNEAEAVTTHALKTCYLAEVVYGTMETFQRDYLLDVFGTQRGKRPFGALILEEVDHMVLNNTASVEEISSTFPGVESLRYIYVEIWMALLATEESYPGEVRETCNSKWRELNELRMKMGLEEKIAIFSDHRLKVQNEIYQSVHTQIKEKVQNGLEAIPKHLVKFVENSLDKWIDSAILAMYKLKENEDYCLKPGKGGVTVVMPMQHNYSRNQSAEVAWSNGISQFLQIKHNLDFTSESTPICRISSYGYINLYGPNILGVASTFGSKAEHDSLEKMYAVEYVCIPVSREIQVAEITGKCVDDTNWAKVITVDSYMKCFHEVAAVVIICKTVEDCYNVEECMRMIGDIKILPAGRLLEEPSTKVISFQKLYELDETTLSPTLARGHVFLVTANVARRVHFCITELLRSEGVVDVCLGFCPETEREKQTLLRSVYRRNRGITQMIVRRSEVDALKQYLGRKRTLRTCESESSLSSHEIPNPSDTDSTELWYPVVQIVKFWDFEPENKLLYDLDRINTDLVKDEFDCSEKTLKSTLPTLHFQDQLSHRFWWLSHQFHSKHLSFSNVIILQQSLHEYWSTWVSSKEVRGVIDSLIEENQRSESDSIAWENFKDQLNKKMNDLFKEFEDLALLKGIICCSSSVLNDSTVQCNHSSANIFSNPHYALQEAAFHLIWKDTEKATKSIEGAIATGVGDDELLFAAYMKKFHAAVSSACSDDSLAALTHGRFDCMDPQQKEEAKQSLLKANYYLINHKKSVEKLIQRIQQSLPLLAENLKENTLFLKSETPELRIPRFLTSELHSLRFAERQVSHFLGCLETSQVEGATTAEQCTPAIGSVMKPNPASVLNIQQLIHKAIRADLERDGLETLQDFYAAPGVKNLISHLSTEKIAAGVLALSEMTVFPCNTAIGGALIFDGITEVALASLEGNLDSNDQLRLIRISCCVSLLMSENFPICVETAKLLRRGEEGSRFLSSKLKSCPSQSGCNSLANQFQKFGDFFCRAAHAMNSGLDYSSSILSTTSDIKSIPAFLAVSPTLDKLQLCQQVIGARIMERQEALFVNVVLKDFKELATVIVHNGFNKFREHIKYVDKDTFLQACLQVFDDSFEDLWRTICDDVVDEIKEKYANLDDKSNNFYNGYQLILNERMRPLAHVDTLITYCGNYMPTASIDTVRTVEELIQHKAEFVVDAINEFVRDESQKISDERRNISNNDLPSSDMGSNTEELSELKMKIGAECKFSGEVSVGKLQLAYMMVVWNLLRDSELLRDLRNGSSPTLESLQMLSERLGCSDDARLTGEENDMIETTERKKNLLSKLVKERLERKIQWHRQIQWNYSKLLGGFPWFEYTDYESKDPAEGHSSHDLEASCDALETQPSDPGKSMSHPTRCLQSCHSMTQFSSPKKGLEFMKNDMSVQALSTFVDISSQVKALNACLRMLEDPLNDFFLAGHTGCEVHVDASQLDLDFELEYVELSRNDEGNPIQSSTLSPVRFISLFVGDRESMQPSSSKTLFKVQSIFPRAELPGELEEGEPWYIIPRNSGEDSSGGS